MLLDTKYQIFGYYKIIILLVNCGLSYSTLNCFVLTHYFLFSAPRSSSGNSGTNNLPPLLFHDVHGENIRVSRDGAVARRANSFCKGVTFTNRPVKISEKVNIINLFYYGMLSL